MKNYILAMLLFAILLFGCVGQSTPQTPTQGGQNTQVPNSGSGGINQNSGSGSVSNTNQNPDNTQSVSVVESREVNFNSDGWNIYATMYRTSNNPTKVIVLAHMYSHDRSDYPDYFIEKIQNEIPEAIIMAVDLRGHGKSTNLGRDDSLSSEQIAGMKNDVVAAKNYAKNLYPSIREAYAVGASIGSTATILASEDREFTKEALLSPALGYRDVSTREAIQNFRGKLLIVTSGNDDPDSRNSVNTMMEISGASSKQLKAYPEGHGSEIFGIEGSTTPKLDDLLVEFLKN
jgi:hypothetical protein